MVLTSWKLCCQIPEPVIQESHIQDVTQIQLSGTGRYLLTVSAQDGCMKIWDSYKRLLIKSQTFSFETDAAFSANEEEIIIGIPLEGLFIYDLVLDTFTRIDTINNSDLNFNRLLAVNPAGNSIAYLNGLQELIVRNLKTNKYLQIGDQYVTGACFDNDNNLYYVSDSRNKNVEVGKFNCGNKVKSRLFDISMKVGDRGPAIRISENGNYLAIYTDNWLRVHTNKRNGELLYDFFEQYDSFKNRFLSFDRADGIYITHYDSLLRITLNKKLEKSLIFKNYDIRSLNLNQFQNLIALGYSKGQVELFDPVSKNTVWISPRNSNYAFDFKCLNTENKIISLGDPSRIGLWNLSSPNLFYNLVNRNSSFPAGLFFHEAKRELWYASADLEMPSSSDQSLENRLKFKKCGLELSEKEFKKCRERRNELGIVEHNDLLDAYNRKHNPITVFDILSMNPKEKYSLNASTNFNAICVYDTICVVSYWPDVNEVPNQKDDKVNEEMKRYTSKVALINTRTNTILKEYPTKETVNNFIINKSNNSILYVDRTKENAHDFFEIKLRDISCANMSFSQKDSLSKYSDIIQSYSLKDTILAVDYYTGAEYYILLWNLNRKICFDTLNFGRNPVLEIDFSGTNPQELYVVSGNTIFSYDLKQKAIRKDRFYTNKSNIYKIHPLSDRWIVVNTFDGFLKLFDIRDTGRVVMPKLQLFSFENDFIVINDSNYYMGSKSVAKHIGFKLKNQAYTFEEFDLKYNRPDKVLKSIGMVDQAIINTYFNAHLKRKANAPVKTDKCMTAINVINKSDFIYSTNNSEIEPIIKIDSECGVSKLVIINNDVPILGRDGQKIQIITGEQKLKHKISLIPGVNKITIIVFNEFGQESNKEQFEVTYINSKKPDLYLLIVSVSYSNAINSLASTLKDSRDIYRLFTTDKSRFNNVFLDTLFERRTTRDEILKTKTWLSKSKPGDMVLIFFNGHGFLSKDLGFYFGTYNVDFNAPDIAGLTFEEIENLLDDIPALNKALFLNACHSGLVDKSPTQPSDTEIKAFDLMVEQFNTLDRGTGASIICSSSGYGFSLDGKTKNENSLFVLAILRGLGYEEADLNLDHRINISELKTYITVQVETASAGYEKPMNRYDIIQNDFRIW